MSIYLNIQRQITFKDFSSLRSCVISSKTSEPPSTSNGKINGEVNPVKRKTKDISRNSSLTKLMKWITADPKVCHGKPVFKGTRILVSDILELLASGMSVEEIINEYPNLNEEMIREALDYAAKVIKREYHVKFEVSAG